MEALERICACLPGDVARRARQRADDLTELRLRPGGRPQLCFAGGDELLNQPLSPEEFRNIAARMLEFSLYAWEDELRRRGCARACAPRFCGILPARADP